jgi:hypothetical protein
MFGKNNPASTVMGVVVNAPVRSFLFRLDLRISAQPLGIWGIHQKGPSWRRVFPVQAQV